MRPWSPTNITPISTLARFGIAFFNLSRGLCILTHDVDNTEVGVFMGIIDDGQERGVLDIDASV